MLRTARLIGIACLCCAASTAAWAQPDIRANEWSRGTTLDGFAGVAVDSSRSGPVIGGVLGWELTPRLAVEGAGAWVEFGDDTTAFSGALRARARLFPRKTVDPFVTAGVGLYRAAFSARETEVPDFYNRRMSTNLPGGGRTFTDPTIVAGAGVNLFVGRNLAIRPDVEAAMVLRGGRRHLVTTVALHALYLFESHPVTPARTR
jgi:hypothetical protein